MTNEISLKGFTELTKDESINIEGGFWFGVIGAICGVYALAYVVSEGAGKATYYITH